MGEPNRTGQAVKAEQLRNYELSLLDNLLEGCQIVDFNWRYVYLNEAAISHARKDRNELIGKRQYGFH